MEEETGYRSANETENGSEKLEHEWMWEGKWDGKKRQLSFKIIVKITEVGGMREKET